MLRPTWSRRLRGDAIVDIDVGEAREEVVLALRSTRPDTTTDELTIHVRLGHPAYCRQNEWLRPWDMEPRLGRSAFGDAVAWAIPQLGRHEDDLRRRSLVESCQAVATRAVALADPDARESAARLAGEARMFVYSALLEDPTGRVAQMIDTCPAVLLFAARSQLEHVVHGIRRGDRLRALLEEVCRASGLRHRQSHALLRRLPAEVATEAMIDAAAVREIDVNDMPATDPDRARWFVTVANWSRIASSTAPELRASVGAFVSRHAVDIAVDAQRRGMTSAALFREMVDWIRATRAPMPSRRSGVGHVLEAVREWHEALWDDQLIDPETELSLGPVATSAIEDVNIQPIRTAGELYDEGRRMHHCIAFLTSDAVAGACFVYRGIVASQRVTVAIEARGAGWQLIEAAGFANAAVERPDLVERWVDALGQPVSRRS